MLDYTIQMVFILDILSILREYVMKTISLKIDDSIFGDTEHIVALMKKPRNRYINEAIDYYNRLQKRKILEQKIRNESLLVKDNSMSVLKEFERIEYGD